MNTQSGITLFEFVICLMLTSVFLVGVDMLQVTSVHTARASLYFNTAMQQMDVMINRLLVMRGEKINEIFERWNLQNQALLPLGHGIITGAYPEYVVSVFWGGEDMLECRQNHPGPKGCVRQSVRIA